MGGAGAGRRRVETSQNRDAERPHSTDSVVCRISFDSTSGDPRESGRTPLLGGGRQAQEPEHGVGHPPQQPHPPPQRRRVQLPRARADAGASAR